MLASNPKTVFLVRIRTPCPVDTNISVGRRSRSPTSFIVRKPSKGDHTRKAIEKNELKILPAGAELYGAVPCAVVFVTSCCQ